MAVPYLSEEDKKRSDHLTKLIEYLEKRLERAKKENRIIIYKLESVSNNGNKSRV